MRLETPDQNMDASPSGDMLNKSNEELLDRMQAVSMQMNNTALAPGARMIAKIEHGLILEELRARNKSKEILEGGDKKGWSGGLGGAEPKVDWDELDPQAAKYDK